MTTSHIVRIGLPVLCGLFVGHLLGYLPEEFMLTTALLLTAVGSFLAGMIYQLLRLSRPRK